MSAEKAPKGGGRDMICPNCGGELHCTTAPMNYGATIEQCEHVARCGYMKTLESFRYPAHAKRPRGEEKPRPGSRGATRAAAGVDESRVTIRSNGRRYTPTTRPQGDRQRELLAALPVAPADPVRAKAIASRLDRPTDLINVMLGQLCAKGKVERVPIPGTTRFVAWRRIA